MNAILSFITWDIDPVLFKVGPLEIRYYGLLWALSFIVGFYLVKKLFLNEKEDEKLADPLLYSVIIGAVLGARLGHVIFYQSELFSQDFFSVFLPIKFYVNGEFAPEFSGFSGLASHGGLIGIAIALFWYKTKKSTRSYFWILDKVAVPSAIACVFIRLANFMNSEIIGMPTDSDYGVVFGNLVKGFAPITNEPIYEDFARHPSQLYEAGFYFLIFGLLMWLYWKKKAYLKEGTLFGVFLITVFIARFIVEYSKVTQGGVSDEYGLPVSTGQLLSIPFVLLGTFILWKVNKKKV